MIIIEDGSRPTTHFYGLVKLGSDQTAAAQFRLLKSRFEADGVWQSIRTKMVALVRYTTKAIKCIFYNVLYFR